MLRQVKGRHYSRLSELFVFICRRFPFQTACYNSGRLKNYTNTTYPMTTDFDIPLFLKNLPNLPGVYRFFDEGGNVLYVGKAVNLKRRVSG